MTFSRFKNPHHTHPTPKRTSPGDERQAPHHQRRRGPVTLVTLLCFVVFMTTLTSWCLADGAPYMWQMGLQRPHSPVMAQIHKFHDFIFHVQWIVSLLVGALLVYIVIKFRARKKSPPPSKVAHNTKLEILWTIIPLMVILGIMYPSLKLLFFVDVVPPADMTIKAVGHQWYWSYEYPDHGNISFESRMIPDDEIRPGQLRLLSTDNRVVLPTDTTIRVITTSDDVIHSWAIPAFGVKKDSIPGRLNETWLRIDKPGDYYGQCSELCGAGHGFMPIDIKAVTPDDFKSWVKTKAPSPPSHESDPTTTQ